MSNKKVTNIRMDDETKALGSEQAAKLGLNLSEYLRMCIHLDVSNLILQTIKKSP